MTSATMRANIQHVPTEVILAVAKDLDFEDLMHLALTCRRFCVLFYDAGVCRALLQVRQTPTALDELGHDADIPSDTPLMRSVFLLLPTGRMLTTRYCASF